MSGYGRAGLSRGRVFVPRQTVGPKADATPITKVDDGLQLDRSPGVIPTSAATDLDHVRFEGGGIRKDFGYRSLGVGAPSRILGLAEHKFIDANNNLKSRFVRIYREVDGKLMFQVWDEHSSWIDGVKSAVTLRDNFLSTATLLDTMYVADGATLMSWDETPSDPNKENDFPAGNSLTSVGAQTLGTVIEAKASGNTYTVHWKVSLTISGYVLGDVVPGIFVDILDPALNVLATRFYGFPGDGTFTWTNESTTFTQDLDPSDILTLKVSSEKKQVNHTLTFSVHGFNKATDADPSAGITYTQVATPSTTFAAVTGAPAARYIVAFENRLIALGDVGAPDALSWTVNGSPSDWTGIGSGQINLVDSRTDPVDELMAAGAVASNVLAIVRRRSIMRARPSGNVALALNVENWIEGLGTDARFSVVQVKDGIMFLGHDIMVYYFNGATGPIAVGESIHQELINDVSCFCGDQDDIDAAYDPVFGEYLLSVPDSGSVWIFNLDLFIQKREKVWRKRSLTSQRISTVSIV